MSSIILIEYPKESKPITHKDLRCTNCGSDNYIQTLRGTVLNENDTNRYECLDCGHTGYIGEMYKILVKE